MEWDKIIERVAPYVVHIDTPDGGGTGFLCLYNDDKSWAGIATAAHVVARADEWQQPLRISSEGQSPTLLAAGERVVFLDWQTDSAVIFFPNNLSLPENLIPLLPASDTIPVGSSVGWLGFPGIARDTLCFFSGNVSAIETTHDAFLIDGVAINGVSGGPVINYTRNLGAMRIMGVLTAYRPNRLYGEALPGLSVAQNVSHFHSVLLTIKNIDEARRKKSELEAESEKEGQRKKAEVEPVGVDPQTKTKDD